MGVHEKFERRIKINLKMRSVTSAWRDDPVTCTELEHPYLASDGVTYSRHSIERAMQMDPWHRSPVTGEVLRPKCFRNSLIRELLDRDLGMGTGTGSGSDDDDDDDDETSIFIYDAVNTPLPENGGEISWRLPLLSTVQVATFKMKWYLDDNDSDSKEVPLQLTVRVMRDAGGMHWLMHPPPPEELWDDMLEVATVFNVHKAVGNPWCLTTAVLGKKTVEEHCIEMHARSCSK